MKKEIAKFLILIAVAFGSGPVGAAVWQWSKTAGLNGNSDPTINFSEGMAPSAVNDSARAMMAALANYRDDISGLLIAGGTSTAYTVTTNQGLNTTPNDGQLLSFRVTVSNGNSPTLQADGGTAFPIVIFSGGVTTPVPAATLLAGPPYSAMFSAGNSSWELRNFYSSPLTVPLGGLVAYTLATVPNSNFVFPAGQCLSTTTYATYWVALGSPASGSCAGGQFRILDMSGRAPVGLDTMPGFSAANRLTSSSTGCGTAMTSVGAACANGVEGSAIALTQLPSITSAGTVTVTVTSSDALNVQGPAVLNVSSGGPTSGFAFQQTTRTITSTGGGAASVTSSGTNNAVRPQVMPAIGLTYLLRVL